MTEYYVALTIDGESLDEQGGYSSKELLTILSSLREQIIAGRITAYVRSKYESDDTFSKGFVIDEPWLERMKPSLDEYAPKDEDFDTVPDEEEEDEESKNSFGYRPVKTLKDVGREHMHQHTSSDAQEAFNNPRQMEAFRELTSPMPPRPGANTGNPTGLIKINKSLVRKNLKEQLQERINEFFMLTRGEWDLGVDPDDDPDYNNDAFELAILDKYLSFEEVVEMFKNQLRENVKIAANESDRSDETQQALNSDYVDLSQARPNPTFLANYDMRTDNTPKESEADQNWVNYVPESMHIRTDEEVPEEDEAPEPEYESYSYSDEELY